MRARTLVVLSHAFLRAVHASRTAWLLAPRQLHKSAITDRGPQCHLNCVAWYCAVVQLEALKLSLSDFRDALGRIQPSVSGTDSAMYEKWSAEFGST